MLQINLSVSLNDKVKVKLTKHGFEIYAKYWHSLHAGILRHGTHIIEIPLWELMQIFGDRMYVRHDNPVFENEEIILECKA